MDELVEKLEALLGYKETGARTTPPYSREKKKRKILNFLKDPYFYEIVPPHLFPSILEVEPYQTYKTITDSELVSKEANIWVRNAIFGINPFNLLKMGTDNVYQLTNKFDDYMTNKKRLIKYLLKMGKFDNLKDEPHPLLFLGFKDKEEYQKWLKYDNPDLVYLQHKLSKIIDVGFLRGVDVSVQYPPKDYPIDKKIFIIRDHLKYESGKYWFRRVPIEFILDGLYFEGTKRIEDYDQCKIYLTLSYPYILENYWRNPSLDNIKIFEEMINRHYKIWGKQMELKKISNVFDDPKSLIGILTFMRTNEFIYRYLTKIIKHEEFPWIIKESERHIKLGDIGQRKVAKYLFFHVRLVEHLLKLGTQKTDISDSIPEIIEWNSHFIEVMKYLFNKEYNVSKFILKKNKPTIRMWGYVILVSDIEKKIYGNYIQKIERASPHIWNYTDIPSLYNISKVSYYSFD